MKRSLLVIRKETRSTCRKGEKTERKKSPIPLGRNLASPGEGVSCWQKKSRLRGTFSTGRELLNRKYGDTFTKKCKKGISSGGRSSSPLRLGVKQEPNKKRKTQSKFRDRGGDSKTCLGAPFSRKKGPSREERREKKDGGS